MRPEERSAGHPDFRYCCVGAEPLVFIFERSRYIRLEGAALDEYRERKATVERLGGRMILSEWDGGGERPTFTAADVEAMKAAVLKANPDIELRSCWNGAGCYTASIGARLRQGAR